MEMEFTKDLWISIHEKNQWKGDRIFLVGWIDSLIFPAHMKQKTPFRNSVQCAGMGNPLGDRTGQRMMKNGQEIIETSGGRPGVREPQNPLLFLGWLP